MISKCAKLNSNYVTCVLFRVFFELMRFDFVLDEDLNVYLMEVSDLINAMKNYSLVNLIVNRNYARNYFQQGLQLIAVH